MKTVTYQPIDCNLYDVLVSFAMSNQVVNITYQNTLGKSENISERIQDIFTKQKEEFVLLKNGQTIRLDNLKKINDQKFGGQYCSI